MIQAEIELLAPPVQGRWAIMNPPGHPRLAFDFLAVDRFRLPYPAWSVLLHLFAILPVRLCFSWSRPVVAPVDGVVAASSDGAPDRVWGNLFYDLLRLSLSSPPPGSPFARYGGNHVVIQAGQRFVPLAHLRCGSIQVKAGDVVRVGDAIGQVGNSGSSIQPHLHIQVMRTADLFPLFANLTPFTIACATNSGRPLKNGDVCDWS
jgi:hypothetical protein